MYKAVGWGEGVQSSRVGGGGGGVYKTVGWGEGVQNSRVEGGGGIEGSNTKK